MADLPLSVPQAPGARGVPFLILGIAVFSVQDVILKGLSGDYPLHQAMVLRSLTAFPLLLALVWAQGGLRSLAAPGWPLMVVRGLTMFAAYTSYYLALAGLPIATTVALYFSAPLFITLLSVLVLGEKVGPRRWAAVTAGFAGVVVMLRPGTELFDWAALLAVFSGAAYGGSMVWARRLGLRHGAAAQAFWGNAVFLALALALAAVYGNGAFAGDAHPSLAFLTRGWAMPTAADTGLMMACGVIAALGLTLLTQAYRMSPANVVAPFEYTALLWGVLYGWLVWRDWPDLIGWTGIAIIVGSGLYVLYREGRAAQ